MEAFREFSASANGDRWFVGRDEGTGELVVLHRANPSSGGAETITPVDLFLATDPSHPERQALAAFLETVERGEGADKTQQSGPDPAVADTMPDEPSGKADQPQRFLSTVMGFLSGVR
ncbi:hypothetical protein [Sinorhizobium sp. BG8]|uniref:hypothetical protein n=1 Tax=Sinorhizobium sp. BG8 TaxID=2613773 RepID=UPI00193D9471|nr:hypothetical protein [Sinorhizobium sp. BG8]QRM55169.1 hypothetical protein F3Y30_11950 [Sinorhizobium sp. BG8]